MRWGEGERPKSVFGARRREEDSRRAEVENGRILPQSQIRHNVYCAIFRLRRSHCTSSQIREQEPVKADINTGLHGVRVEPKRWVKNHVHRLNQKGKCCLRNTPPILRPSKRLLRAERYPELLATLRLTPPACIRQGLKLT